MLAGQRFHLVVIDGFLGIEAVGDDLEPFSGHVQRHAVRQVAAFGEAHAHDRVARLGKSHQHRLVGLRARIWLHVRRVIVLIRIEQFLQAVDGDLLGNIDMLATTVVALAGVAFGILVGQLRTLRRHDGVADVVLGGNQLDVLFLAAILIFNRLPQFRINFRQGIFRGKHRLPHQPLKGRGL